MESETTGATEAPAAASPSAPSTVVAPEQLSTVIASPPPESADEKQQQKEVTKTEEETKSAPEKQAEMARVDGSGENWGGQDADEKAEKQLVLAVRCTGFGGFDKIKVERIEARLEVPPGHVEVQVKACGVNFADLYMRQGLMRDRTPPFTLGMECTGHVISVAKDVEDFKIGDRVACFNFKGGLHQEFVTLPATNCYPLPQDVPYEDGAALIVTYLTAYFCVIDIGNIQPGQSILVHSCAGGVGWACTQLAHTVPDVTVLGVCSSSAKHEAVRTNGVQHVLSPATYEMEARVAAPQGINLVVDSVGGANFSISQKLLRPLGRAVLIGASNMMHSERRLSLWEMICSWWRTTVMSPTDLINRSAVVAGLHLGNLAASEPQRVRQAMATIFELYRQGKIKPRIDSVWAFDKAADAMKVLQERRNIGKVILKPVIK